MGNSITSSPVSQTGNFTEHIFFSPRLLPIGQYIKFLNSHPHEVKKYRRPQKANPNISKAIVGIDIVEVPSFESQYWPLPTDKVKQEVRERDHYTCQICGEWGNVVDHIIPLRISHDSSLKNLRTLCCQCNIDTRLQRRDARPDFDTWLRLIQDGLTSKPKDSCDQTDPSCDFSDSITKVL